MKISDLLTLSLNNLKRRKGRTILTVLGVFIGTCSIIMMLSIGVALNKSIDDMMQGMGDLTLIEVYNWGGSANGGSVDPMTDEGIDGLGRNAQCCCCNACVSIQFVFGKSCKRQ